jgi:hypothetical protein
MISRWRLVGMRERLPEDDLVFVALYVVSSGICRNSAIETGPMRPVRGARRGDESSGELELVDEYAIRVDETVLTGVQVVLPGSKALLRRAGTRGLIGIAAMAGAATTSPPRTPC